MYHILTNKKQNYNTLDLSKMILKFIIKIQKHTIYIFHTPIKNNMILFIIIIFYVRMDINPISPSPQQ